MSGYLSTPQELENMLSELKIAMNASIENPPDLVENSADYFSTLRDLRRNDRLQTAVEEGNREEIAKIFSERAAARRNAFCGGSYNPEDDDDDGGVQVIPKSDSEKERIKNLTRNMFLFRKRNDENMDTVIDAMVKKPVTKGEIIVKEGGEDGDTFYLIDSGVFHVYIEDKNGEDECIGAFDNEGSFGLLALLYNQQVGATIKADTDGSLWAIDRKTFNKIIFKRAFQEREMYMELLEGVDQLKPLSDYEKMEVTCVLITKYFSSEGDVIVKEGDEGDGMYFIVKGVVQVMKQKLSGSETKEEEIARLGIGDYFGELALIKHQPRAATVIASVDTTVGFLEVNSFERLLQPCVENLKKYAETYDKK